jgi:hypothetical protein
MKTYTLYNKRLKRQLIHPRIGLWFTNSIDEANEMLDACHEYLKSSGLSGNEGDFVIVWLNEDEWQEI